ncbi:MAG: polyprenyl synthetase family protein [Solirubrobacteraceae bacterium]|nr:polyprenyl synthetase family protein [Solirubrobacteraceae bacterium]
MEDAAPQTGELVIAGGDHIPPLLKEIEERLQSEAVGYGAPLQQFGEATIAAGGKRLRPLLLLLCAGPPQGESQRDALIRAGAAIELIHSATLVHDDVLDQADLRRGKPTVVSLAGRDAAISTGDLLFARAFSLITENGDPDPVQLLSDACSALARGELLQRADSWNSAVTLERYLERCELKTARLFEAACAIAAAITDERQLQLASFGRRIGVAFQLLDDVLDVSGPAERTGKHRGTDLLDGTVTLPLIIAREKAPAIAALDLRSLSGAEEAELLCDQIAATGALEESRDYALALVEEAKQALPVELDERRRRSLELVADSVVARYS